MIFLLHTALTLAACVGGPAPAKPDVRAVPTDTGAPGGASTLLPTAFEPGDGLSGPGRSGVASFAAAAYSRMLPELCRRVSAGPMLLQRSAGCAIAADVREAPSVPVTTPHPGVQIAVGERHACARRLDGTVWCWGLNTDGELGDGSTVASSAVPVRVAGIDHVRDVHAARDRTCAVRDDGSVWCWGGGKIPGIIGPNRFGPHRLPVQVAGVATAVQVAVGERHTCARLSDGTLACWGVNTEGQLGVLPGVGDVAHDDRFWRPGDDVDPIVVPGVSGVVDVAANGRVGGLADRTFFVTRDGRVMALGGASARWEIRQPTDIGSSPFRPRRAEDVAPEPIPVRDATRLAVGHDDVCAIRTNGELWCWSENARLRGLPGGTPSAVAAGVVTAGADTCSIEAEGRVACWNAAASCAGVSGYVPPAHRIAFAGIRAASVDGTWGFTCIGGRDDEVWCFGMSTAGRLGQPGVSDLMHVTTPTRVVWPH